MIGSLRGILLDRSPRGEVLVEVGGVGYRVQVSPGAPGLPAELGAPLFLHVHTHVRDDAIILYGFPDRDTRACFEALIATHGIGPAVALNILSVHSPSALQRIVGSGDAESLTLVPGIGKKTAARLLLELKAKLDVDDLDLDGGDVGTAGANGSPRGEVRAALAGLGYGPDEVRDAVRDLPEEGPVGDLLRHALKHLASVR